MPRCTARATLRFAASRPPLSPIASATARTPAAVASAIDADRGRLALRLVDRRLLLAFRPQHRGLLLAVGDVDLLLPLAFGFGDQRALLALGGDLRCIERRIASGGVRLLIS